MAACRLSLVAVNRGYSSLQRADFSLWWLLSLWSTGSRHMGSVGASHGLSCPVACGIFPDQGWNLCPLHCRVDSYPLDHQGSPLRNIFIKQLPYASYYPRPLGYISKQNGQKPLSLWITHSKYIWWRVAPITPPSNYRSPCNLVTQITDRSFAYAMTNGRNTEGCGTGGLLKDHSWELSHWGWVLGSCFSFPPTQLPLLSVVVHMVQLEGWTLVVPDQILWFQAWLTAPSPYPPSRWLWESHFQLLWASVSSTVKWSHVMMTLYSGHEY